MATVPRIAIHDSDSSSNSDIGLLLADCNYRVVTTQSAGNLGETLAVEHWNLLLLDAVHGHSEGLATAKALREKYGWHFGLVMLTPADDSATRIASLNAGADACVAHPVSQEELKAVIDRLVMRLAIPPAPHAVGLAWQVDASSRQLVCPNARRVPLTVTETKLLQTLLAQPGQSASRDTLCCCLPPGNNHDTRRLDSIFSRLRSKTRKVADADLPIHTLRNQGYTFAGNRRASDWR